MLNWNANSQVFIQGIAEPLGLYCAGQMQAYGTEVVAGVSAGYGGEILAEIPVFDLVETAITQVGMPQLSLIAVHPYWVLDAALEAMSAGIQQLVILTQGVPPLDMIRLLNQAKTTQTQVFGSGNAGIIIPEQMLVGSCDPNCYSPGKIAILSRSDYLTDAIAWELTQKGLGQSIVLHCGTDDLINSQFREWFSQVEQDPKTEVIVLLEQTLCGIGEIAPCLPKNPKKPVIAYIAGQNVPLPQQSQEASTLIASRLSQLTPHTSTAAQKIAAYKDAKISVAKSLGQLTELLQKVLKQEATQPSPSGTSSP